jgi:hypothetical protein
MIKAGVRLVPSDIDALRETVCRAWVTQDLSPLKKFIFDFEDVIFSEGRTSAAEFDYQLVNYSMYKMAKLWELFPEDDKRVQKLFNFVGTTYFKDWKPFDLDT